MSEARILDGKRIALAAEMALGERIGALARRGIQPGLTVIRVGDDPASEIYVRNKARRAEQLGLRSLELHLPATLPEEDLLAMVGRLNADDSVDGILVQLPLPPHINSGRVLEAIDPAKDVDGFHPINVGRLHLGQPSLLPCTPAGVIRMLDAEGIPLRGLNAVVVGRSDIVGKPVAALLLQRDATVTICHSKTRDLASFTRGADLLVSASGRPGLITASMVRQGAVVIDVGINRVEGPGGEELLRHDPRKLEILRRNGFTVVGDVDFAQVRLKAGWITPVPGGVGPMTIAMLMENSVKAAEERRR
jgi:methylenetetrahydrofolate dehydrogenase (NADP+)/methenyltetrahydrofolate cyclohydrolase